MDLRSKFAYRELIYFLSRKNIEYNHWRSASTALYNMLYSPIQDLQATILEELLSEPES